jgi:predicted TIM-barrel fold metal-dependent hydrolase
MSYYRFDNSYMLDMIRLHPDRLVGTAIVDPLGPDPAAEMRALRPKGVRAFRIQPEYSKQPPERWLNPPGYKAMFSEAERSGQAMSCLIDPSGFSEIDRMCGLYPNSPVIIDHIGRVGVDGTIRDEDVDALVKLAKHPRLHVKIGAFYALGRKTPPYLDLVPLIERVVKAYGPRRCFWETDCPFQVVKDSYADSLALVRDHLPFLSEADRDWLLAKTAESLLFSS